MQHKKILSDVVIPRGVAADQLFRPPPMRVRPPSERRIHFPTKTIVVLVAVGVLGTWVSIRGARMEVRVVARVATVAVDSTIALRHSETGASWSLFLRTLSVPRQTSSVFSGAVTTSNVERRARGTVVIFNKNPSSQTLVATTRLQSSDGKIYRISNAMSIPELHKEGADMLPGSRTVEVVADKAGPEYNIDLTDFTIPGFLGTPKYKTVFARSKTAIAGGFRGEEQTIAPADLEHATLSLRAEEEAKAFAILASKIPPDAILLRDSVTYAPHEPTVTGKDNSFSVTLSGEAHGAFIDGVALGTLLSQKSLLLPARITNPGNLQYKFSSTSIDALHVAGEARLEALFDSETIRKFIMQSHTKAPEQILAAFSALSRVTVRFRPFWLRRIPSLPSAIDIISEAR